MAERKNINRGYRNLRVWQRAVDLYVLTCEKVNDFPGRPYKVMNQMMGAAASVHGNIAEGYCRRSLREYLNFLNYALASLGELGSYLFASYKAKQLDSQSFRELDELHYEVENSLLKLIKRLQEKQKSGTWEETFVLRDGIQEYGLNDDCEGTREQNEDEL